MAQTEIEILKSSPQKDLRECFRKLSDRGENAYTNSNLPQQSFVCGSSSLSKERQGHGNTFWSMWACVAGPRNHKKTGRHRSTVQLSSDKSNDTRHQHSENPGDVLLIAARWLLQSLTMAHQSRHK